MQGDVFLPSTEQSSTVIERYCGPMTLNPALKSGENWSKKLRKAAEMPEAYSGE
jgi:hypothetical protein